MSRSLNKVTLIGNLGNDPEVRSTTGGNRVATFSLATSRSWNDASGTKQEKTEWHRCVVWNTKSSQLADIVEKYVKKGDKLYVEGRIEYRQWQDKDGQTRYSTEINVRELIMLGGGSGGGRSGADADSEAANGTRARAGSAAKAKAGGGDDFEDFPGALADEDDDLPFCRRVSGKRTGGAPAKERHPFSFSGVSRSVRGQHVQPLLVQRQPDREVRSRADRDRSGAGQLRAGQQSRDDVDAAANRDVLGNRERLGATSEDGAEPASARARRAHEDVRLGERLVLELDRRRLVRLRIDVGDRTIAMTRREGDEGGEDERVPGARGVKRESGHEDPRE
jgi:single-strand DNA-binding protein